MDAEDSESSEDLDYQPPDDDNESSGGESETGDGESGGGDDSDDDDKGSGGSESGNGGEESKDEKGTSAANRKRRKTAADSTAKTSKGKGKSSETSSKSRKSPSSSSQQDEALVAAAAAIKPPKRPIMGYAWFMKSESPKFKGMAFKEVATLLSSRWKTMSENEKKPFIERQDADRRRYEQEMERFSASQEGQMYKQMKLKKSAASKAGRKSKNVATSEDQKGSRKIGRKSKSQTSSIGETSSTVALSSLAGDPGVANCETSSFPFDPLQIPIFTDRFLEFNKKRDHQLRQLRRAASEVENENLQLLSHMKAQNAMISKSEQDAVRLLAHSEAITKQLKQVKDSAIERIKSVPAYSQNETLMNFIEESSDTLESDEFLAELNSFLTSSKVSLSERMAIKVALKKLDYPKDPELS